MPGAIPGHLRFAKVHYAQHLRTLQSEEEDAKSLGEGAADEWRKGLFTKGKDAMADSARWEKWEIQLRLGADLAQVLREYDPSSFSHTQSVQDAHSKHPGVSGTPAPATANGKQHVSFLSWSHSVRFACPVLHPSLSSTLCWP